MILHDSFLWQKSLIWWITNRSTCFGGRHGLLMVRTSGLNCLHSSPNKCHCVVLWAQHFTTQCLSPPTVGILVPRKVYLTFTLLLWISLPGFIKSYFDSLYDEEIITEESFNAWESSSQEEPGKGVAITASSEFFRWLGSAAEEPGEESWPPRLLQDEFI